jgi:hypothetical protein
MGASGADDGGITRRHRWIFVQYPNRFSGNLMSRASGFCFEKLRDLKKREPDGSAEAAGLCWEEQSFPGFLRASGIALVKLR